MNQSADSAPNRMTKEKKQLLLLGGLGMLLVAVLAVPFGEAESPIEVAEIADEQAQTAAIIAEGGAPPVVTAPATNPALSGSGEEAGSIKKSPFESFWSLASPVEKTVDEIPPPTVTLNGTLTSGRTPIAIVDGQMRFIGDKLQGWTIHAIGRRQISIRSPNNAVVTIEMPLLDGTVRRPLMDGGN